MYLDDLKSRGCNISKDLKVSKLDTATIPLLEQELHINRLRYGYADEDSPEVQIDCSDQTMITELTKSEFFILTKVVVSEHERNSDFVLEIKGILEPSGLTIRKKKPQFTEEERKIRSERARKNFQKGDENGTKF